LGQGIVTGLDPKTNDCLLSLEQGIVTGLDPKTNDCLLSLGQGIVTGLDPKTNDCLLSLRQGIVAGLDPKTILCHVDFTMITGYPLRHPSSPNLFTRQSLVLKKLSWDI
jgi:hypothetical protein